MKLSHLIWVILLIAVAASCVPAGRLDVNKTFTYEERYHGGTFVSNVTYDASHALNIYQLTLVGRTKINRSLDITCDKNTSIITGLDRHRAPSVMTESYFCPAGTSLHIRSYHHWVAIVSEGVATKYSPPILSDYSL